MMLITVKLTRSASLKVGKVVLQPSNVDNIKMVSGLIEEENICLEEHGPGEGKLHLPTTGQAANCLSLTLIGESN